LFLCITDRKEGSRHHSGSANRSHLNGKGECCVHFNTSLLFDDNADVCREVEAYGVVPYQIFRGDRRPRKGKGKKGKTESDPRFASSLLESEKGLSSHWVAHPPHPSFPEAVAYFLADWVDGDFSHKVKILDAQRKYGGRPFPIAASARARQERDEREN
jgi:hypothetical protein